MNGAYLHIYIHSIGGYVLFLLFILLLLEPPTNVSGFSVFNSFPIGETWSVAGGWYEWLVFCELARVAARETQVGPTVAVWSLGF